MNCTFNNITLAVDSIGSDNHIFGNQLLTACKVAMVLAGMSSTYKDRVSISALSFDGNMLRDVYVDGNYVGDVKVN